MRWRDLDSAVSARAILVAGWVLFVIYAYPGLMSFDSVWQLQQARHLEPYNDWQPPVMAVMWRVTDLIMAGPFPMLVLQSTAFLLGAFGLLRHVMSERWAALVAAGVLLAPQSIVVMAVVWKDCQMAGFLLASIAALLSPRRRWRIVGYGLIFLATAVRYNAAAATLPIVLGFFGRGVVLGFWRRSLTAIALWLGVTVAAFVVNQLIVEHKTHVWQAGSATVDIAGIVRYTPAYRDDALLLRDTPGVPWIPTQMIRHHVRVRYSPANSFLDITRTAAKVIEYPTTPAQLAAITTAWKKLVREHPVAFVRHRLGVFRSQLELRTGGAGGFWTGFVNADWAEVQLEHQARHAWVQDAWIDGLVWFDAWFGLRVCAYFTLAILLVPLCRGHRLAGVLLISGIFYQLGLLLVAPATDYRYSHWTVIATLLGTVILLVTRSRQGPTQRGLGAGPGVGSPPQ
jgi:hypothetical protein